MISDSSIASLFKCGKVKSFYLTNHGGSSILKIIPVRQNQGVCCAFWCKHEFKDRRISMCISGRGQKWAHATILLSLLSMLPLRLWSVCFKLPPTLDLHLSELIQISINSPIVNGKVYDLVHFRLHQETNKSKLNTGSCGLHILHSAFKFGVKASGRNIDEFLRNMHWLLEDTPDSREYYRISVETKPLMPLQFCKTRSTENIPVIGLTVDMLPQLRQYNESGQRKQSTRSLDIVKETC